jgi:hypothetical protein
MAFKVKNALRGTFQSEDFAFENDGEFIEGYLVEVAELTGKKGKMRGKKFKKYTLKTENGFENFLGGTVIDKGLSDTPIGALVRVTYLGWGEPKEGGSAYKNYRIEEDSENTIDVPALIASLPKTTTTGTTAADIVAAARVG